MAHCVVSFLDTDGVRHAVEVEAESMYEAAAVAMHTFRMLHCEPGDLSKLEIEIRTSITHTITPKKVRAWLQSSAKSPKDMVLKERLRALL
jgi:hypothetical protein